MGTDLEDEAAETAIPPAPDPPPDRVDARLRNSALLRWGFFAGCGVALAVVLSAALYDVRAMLVRALVAMFIAVSLDPAVQFLVRRGIRRSLAVVLLIVILGAVIAAFFVSIAPSLVSQGEQLAHHIPQDVSTLEHGPLRGISGRLNLSQRLSQLASSLPSTVGNGFLDISTRVLGAAVSLLTVLVLSIYFLLELERLQRGARRLFPVDRRERYGAMVDVVVKKTGDYMIGRIVVAIIAGVVAFVALWITGVAYPVPLAILIAALDIIPLIGHPLGAAIAIIVALFTVPFWPHVIVLLALFIVYSQLENYFIAPRVLRSSLDISSVAVLVAALFGAALLGLVGALVAIPVAAAVKVIALEQIEGHEAAAGPPPPEPKPTRQRHWPLYHRSPAPREQQKT